MIRFAKNEKQITTSEIVVYSVVILGALADILTTHFGLQIQGTYEMNPLVLIGMQNGTWMLLEFACTGSIIFMCWVFMRLDLKYKYLFFLSPLIYAFGRYHCAYVNILVMRGALFG